MPTLEVRDLAKSFGGVVALDGANFDVEAGEVHALLGENGAGKSTFIKILTGVVRADSGRVLYRGEPLELEGPRRAEELTIGAVFQELSLVPDLSVAENVWFRREPLTFIGTIASGRMLRQTRVLLDEMGLQDIDPEREVRSLSVAERQLVEIAKVLSEEPPVMILDEATSALSPKEVSWVLRRARESADRGAAVIFISHRLAEVREVADRITVFRNGRDVGTRLSNEYDDDELVELMLDRKVGRLYPPKEDARTERLALKVRDLRSDHRLRGVDLDLREGEILGIGGLQGQGQPQLLLSLCGLARARGSVEVFGRPEKVHARSRARGEATLALIPEDRRTQGLLLPMSIRENVTLPVLARIAKFGLIDRKRERRLAEEAIQRLNVVARDADQEVMELSGGNQQKVVIAKMLLTEAKVLLLHDLTRGVDVGSKAEIYKLLRELTHDGYSFLFYSTDVTELINIADRVAVMFDGRVNTILEGDHLTEERVLHASVRDVEV